MNARGWLPRGARMEKDRVACYEAPAPRSKAKRCDELGEAQKRQHSRPSRGEAAGEACCGSLSCEKNGAPPLRLRGPPAASLSQADSADSICQTGVLPCPGLLGCRRTAIPASHEQRGRAEKVRSSATTLLKRAAAYFTGWAARPQRATRALPRDVIVWMRIAAVRPSAQLRTWHVPPEALSLVL